MDRIDPGGLSRLGGGVSSSSGAAVDNPACFIANIITLISASGLRVLTCSRVPPPSAESDGWHLKERFGQTTRALALAGCRKRDYNSNAN